MEQQGGERRGQETGSLVIKGLGTLGRAGACPESEGQLGRKEEHGLAGSDFWFYKAALLLGGVTDDGGKSGSRKSQRRQARRSGRCWQDPWRGVPGGKAGGASLQGREQARGGPQGRQELRLTPSR